MKEPDCQILYQNGEHYDRLNADVVLDIPFYLEVARKFPGPILELACGTGRITIPLAQKGFQVYGLDISPGMLVQARTKALNAGVHIHWILSDCRDFAFNTRFGLIIVPFNALLHLHDRESLEACLRCIRRHLHPDGRFILDIFNPGLPYLTRSPDQRYPVGEYLDPDGGGQVVVTETNVYERDTQINRIKWFTRIGEQPESVSELNLRMYYPREMDALLHYNGFEIEHKFGEADGTPFGHQSEKQIFICKKLAR